MRSHTFSLEALAKDKARKDKQKEKTGKASAGKSAATDKKGGKPNG